MFHTGYKALVLSLAALILLVSQSAYSNSQPSFKVALIDKFYPGEEAYASEEDKRLELALHSIIDLDNDREREPYFHGDLVSMIVSHPLIEVLPYKLDSEEHTLRGLLRNLNQVHADIAAGADIDALLFPWESSTLVSAFGDKEVNRVYIDRYIGTLRGWSRDSETWHTTVQIIAELEQIASLGTQVYTIAGNGGSRMVNTYSFAKGVVTVGSSNPELSHYIADNALVDLHDQAHYELKRVDDRLGNALGYDVNGNGCVDIGLNQLSGKSTTDLPRSYWKLLKGSSFAAPMALKKELVGDVGAEYCL